MTTPQTIRKSDSKCIDLYSSGANPESPDANCIDLYSSSPFEKLTMKPKYFGAPHKEIHPDTIKEYWDILLDVGGAYPRLADVEDPTFDDVLEMHENPRMSTSYITSKDGVIGEFTLEGKIGSASQVHISFLPWVTLRVKQQASIEILDQILNLWQLDGAYVVDTIIGVIPVMHKAARLYARVVGMTEMGILPNGAVKQGQAVDAIVYTLRFSSQRREKWQTI